jgi:putative copper resistance protein D
METALVLARIAQYFGAATLFGAPLFMVYAFPSARPLPEADRRWLNPTLAGAAAVLLFAAAAYLLLLTANMAGELAAATDPELLGSVLADSAMGWAICARLLAAAAALATALAARPGRAALASLSALGGVALLSFAWTGHGAASEGVGGMVHLAADLLHLAAAGVWIGALAAFALLVSRPAPSAASLEALHGALAGFSGVGSGAVAVIVASGLANSWFLVGPDRLPALFTTGYGLVLTAKVVLFLAMTGLAARNRFSHTPALAKSLAEGAPQPALRRLRSSVLVEAALGFAVLALVGLLGTLVPIASE